ncbi:MAG: helix-turn-helix domain-containing protein, partial [Chloroflexota bacterium]|nr:helix-turn-helix domain-containing protein [Chloroflexota bacterium]
VNTFNRWERGLQLPQLETLDLLCKAFDLPPEELGFGNIIAAKRRTTEGALSMRNENTSIKQEAPQKEAQQSDNAFAYQVEQSDNAFAYQVEQIKKDLDEMQQAQNENGEGLSRKKAVALLVTTPSAIFGLIEDSNDLLLYSDEILALSAVNLALCWQLYYEGGFAELNHILPGYTTQLSALAQKPARHQKLAANLASQAHQLNYLLALQRQDFGTSLKHTQEALHYGHIADDANLQAAALGRKAYVYFSLHRDRQRLQTYQEALSHCTACSPLLKGYIYAGLAETHASLQNEAMAQEFLKRAQKSYPDQPEEDPVYSYTHFRWPTFYNFSGQVHLHLNHPKEAWEAFSTVDRLVPTNEEPYRVELTVYKAATALALQDLEQSCALLAEAVQAARALGSALRYDEAYLIYERMLEQWGQEPRVKALADLFH